MTIVEDTRVITGGVDTHADLHVAAALDAVGGLLGVREFPATAAGYASLLGWLGGFGNLALVGVEGTGSYGAGLARHLAAAGVRVVEVDRPYRQDRHRQGKSDRLMRSASAGGAVRVGLGGAEGPRRGGGGDAYGRGVWPGLEVLLVRNCATMSPVLAGKVHECGRAVVISVFSGNGRVLTIPGR